MTEKEEPRQPQRYCRNCGNQLKPGDTFCRACGGRWEAGDADQFSPSTSRELWNTARRSERQIDQRFFKKVFEDASAQYRDWREARAIERERNEFLRGIERKRDARRRRFNRYVNFFEKAYNGSLYTLDCWQAYEAGESDNEQPTTPDLLLSAGSRAEAGLNRMREMEGTFSDLLEREEFEKADLLLNGMRAGQENVEGEESVFVPLVAVHGRVKWLGDWGNYRAELEKLIKDLEDLLGSSIFRTLAEEWHLKEEKRRLEEVRKKSEEERKKCEEEYRKKREIELRDHYLSKVHLYRKFFREAREKSVYFLEWLNEFVGTDHPVFEHLAHVSDQAGKGECKAEQAERVGVKRFERIRPAPLPAPLNPETLKELQREVMASLIVAYGQLSGMVVWGGFVEKFESILYELGESYSATSGFPNPHRRKVQEQDHLQRIDELERENRELRQVSQSNSEAASRAAERDREAASRAAESDQEVAQTLKRMEQKQDRKELEERLRRSGMPWWWQLLALSSYDDEYRRR